MEQSLAYVMQVQDSRWISTVHRFINCINHANFDELAECYEDSSYFTTNLLEKGLAYPELVQFWSFIIKSSKLVSAWAYHTDTDKNVVKYCVCFKYPETNRTVILDVESVIIADNGKIFSQSDKVKSRMFIAHAYGIVGFIKSCFPFWRKQYEQRIKNFFSNAIVRNM
ncbi:MAG: hypothetical protein J0I09_13565 [Sphingobacteriia bacterium]|nr:hypothetical protein [Sphingobacteriia bacterium]